MESFSVIGVSCKGSSGVGFGRLVGELEYLDLPFANPTKATVS